MNIKHITIALAFSATFLFPHLVSAQSQSGNESGECSGGLCGAPNQSGGGCGCGCGCSILIAQSDMGDTYQFSDDYDGDGLEDDFDNCPFAANAGQADSDGDGMGDVCDNCPASANLGQLDADSDGMGDACDADADNDGFPNQIDLCSIIFDPSQADADNDGLGNACDPDDDNDGILDGVDNCPLVSNPNQRIPSNALCDTDSDRDGLPDSLDNCLGLANFDQLDSDLDGVGDACDADRDGDGVSNAIDNCPNQLGPNQLDSDRDGIGDACDQRFCFVLDRASPDRCLDPQNAFTILAPPNQSVPTGALGRLRMFSNRENTAVRYVWSILSKPDGSEARIENPRGSTTFSNSFENLFLNGQVPAINPDVPGVFVIQVSAELVFPDAQFPGNETSRSTFQLIAEGPSQNGCVCVQNEKGVLNLAPIGLAAFGLMLRRIKKSASAKGKP